MTKISRAKGRTPPRRILREALIGGLEVWAVFDHDTRDYELFASEAAEFSLGRADTIGEAEALARVLIAERRAEVADFAGLAPVQPEDVP